MTNSATVDPTPNRADPSKLFLYFGGLVFLLGIVNPVNYFTDVSTSFMLKDHLHLSADQVSTFRLITALPVYLAFFFGIARDRWNLFGMRDRGLLLLFGPLSGLVFLALAYQKVTVPGMYIGVFLAMLATRFIVAAYQGLISLIGQEKLMSGRLASIWNIVYYIPIAFCSWLGGQAAVHLQPSQTFTALAVLCFAVGLFSLSKPKAVFKGTYDQSLAKTSTLSADVKRLLKHKAIYAPVLIMFLWNFAPGSQTPLQYFLTDTLHASDEAYADFNAIFTISFLPTFFLYLFLCTRVPLKKLLFWGTVIAVPQMVPFLFIHSANSALLMAIPIGLMGGVATAAYYDLAMRSCPAGLQGTLMLMVDGVYYLCQRGGDLLGSWIYGLNKANGFTYCVIAITIVYALILPCLKLIPKGLTDTADGTPNEEFGTELVPVSA